MSTVPPWGDAKPLPGCDVIRPTAGRGSDPPPRPADRVRTRGRFAEINAFIDFTLADLSRAHAAVWLILWRDTKPAGVAATSQEDLARRAGCDARTVRRAIARLEALGLLTVVRRGRLGAGPSAYRVRPTAPGRVGQPDPDVPGNRTFDARGRGHRRPPSHKGPEAAAR